MATSEAEAVEAAIEEAVEMVESGDTPLVAADYVADQADLDHRFRDILNGVRQEVDDAG